MIKKRFILYLTDSQASLWRSIRDGLEKVETIHSFDERERLVPHLEEDPHRPLLMVSDRNAFAPRQEPLPALSFFERWQLRRNRIQALALQGDYGGCRLVKKPGGAWASLSFGFSKESELGRWCHWAEDHHFEGMSFLPQELRGALHTFAPEADYQLFMYVSEGAKEGGKSEKILRQIASHQGEIVLSRHLELPSGTSAMADVIMEEIQAGVGYLQKKRDTHDQGEASIGTTVMVDQELESLLKSQNQTKDQGASPNSVVCLTPYDVQQVLGLKGFFQSPVPFRFGDQILLRWVGNTSRPFFKVQKVRPLGGILNQALPRLSLSPSWYYGGAGLSALLAVLGVTSSLSTAFQMGDQISDRRGEIAALTLREGDLRGALGERDVDKMQHWIALYEEVQGETHHPREALEKMAPILGAHTVRVSQVEWTSKDNHKNEVLLTLEVGEDGEAKEHVINQFDMLVADLNDVVAPGKVMVVSAPYHVSHGETYKGGKTKEGEAGDGAHNQAQIKVKLP